MELREAEVACPYCGEVISVLIDDSLPEQEYIEDCQVCCRPIILRVKFDSIAPASEFTIEACSENDV